MKINELVFRDILVYAQLWEYEILNCETKLTVFPEDIVKAYDNGNLEIEGYEQINTNKP